MNELLAWLAAVAATITICHRLEDWADPKAAERFYRNVTEPLKKDPLDWFHSISSAFLQLFDRIYTGPASSVNKTIWHSILFCYFAFFLSRIILYLFAIPTPTTELLLVTTIVVSLFFAIAREATIRMVALSQSLSTSHSKWHLDHRGDIIKISLLGMAAVYLVIGGTSLIVVGIGASFKNITALSVGASLTFPLGLALIPLQNRISLVSPLRATIGSLAFVLTIAILFPDTTTAFLDELGSDLFAEEGLVTFPDHIVEAVKQGKAPLFGPLAFLAYNFFADALSLVETRLLLRLSIGSSWPRLLGLLCLDFILSATIYLLLPLIAGQDLEVLGNAILFKGSMPWLGILFWSTFATSLIFYLFVASAALATLTSLALRATSWLDGFFVISGRPLRALAAAAVFLETVLFLAFFLARHS